MQLEIFKSKLRLDARTLLPRWPLQSDFDGRIDNKTRADSNQLIMAAAVANPPRVRRTMSPRTHSGSQLPFARVY